VRSALGKVPAFPPNEGLALNQIFGETVCVTHLPRFDTDTTPPLAGDTGPLRRAFVFLGFVSPNQVRAARIRPIAIPVNAPVFTSHARGYRFVNALTRHQP
jgi:hypothetical protein